MKIDGLKWLAFAVHVSTILVCVYVLWRIGPLPSSAASSVTYADFIAVILTALGVMLAVLAAMLAVVAVWGFDKIKSAAEDVARTTASDVASRTTSSLVNQKSVTISDDYGSAAAQENGRDNR